MNCHEAQPQISEYLDGALDPLRTKSIESHLLACPVCRAEADGLADCIRQVAQLPPVDPPPGFAQRVMAHARALEEKPGLWQRIVGLRFPVPVQASAALLIGVLAVLVYRNQSPVENNPSGPSIPAAIAPSRQQPSADGETPARAPAPKAKLDSERLRLAEKPGTLSAPTISASKDSAAQAAAKAEVASVVGELKDLPHRPPIQAQEIATGSENLRQDSNSFGFGPSFSAPFRPGFFAPERVLSPLNEPSADVEFVVRRRESEQKKPEARRAEADARAASAVAKRSATPATPQPNSLTEVKWFTVPAERYDQFKKELAAEATIDSERPIGSMTNDLSARPNRDLLIKVIVLTPLER